MGAALIASAQLSLNFSSRPAPVRIGTFNSPIGGDYEADYEQGTNLESRCTANL